MSDPIRLSVGQIYDQYARSILDKKDMFVDAPSYDALAADLAHWKYSQGVTADILAVAKARIAILETELADSRDRHSWQHRRAEAAETRIRTLEVALTMMYDKWENGDGCYEDPDTCGGFLGNAFKLSQPEEDQVLAALFLTPETK